MKCNYVGLFTVCGKPSKYKGNCAEHARIIRESDIRWLKNDIFLNVKDGKYDNLQEIIDKIKVKEEELEEIEKMYKKR